MDDSVLRRISADIGTLMNASDSDENNSKLMELFYSLIEELGYEDNMIVTPGAFDENGETVFQAALKTDPYIDESIKIYVKFVEKGEDISQYADLVTRVATYALGIDSNKTTYFIVCNLLSFKIYKVEPGQTSLITIDESYEIVDMSNLIEYKYLLDILQAKEIDKPDKLVPPPIKETAPPKEEKEKTLISKELLIKIGLIVSGIILIFLVISFLFKGNDNPTQEDNPTQNPQTSQSSDLPRPNQGNQGQNPNQGGISTESYLTIKGVLDLSVSSKEVLNITLISDLEKGAIVKIGIWCGDNTEYKYINIDNNGQGTTSFTIPATWGDEKIAVGAYLKFNEANYVQPSAVTAKYGENGEYIMWNTDTKDLICSSTTTHSNALVIALKEQAEKELAQQLATTIRKDFSTIDTRVDNFGNIKHVPLGYSFDETNISESINIYPMIYYNAAEKTSYFYIICGYLGTQFYRFESVGFSADGYNWTYDNGSNPYKHQVVGNKKAEWVYFNSVDSNVLINDMELFGNSKDVSLSLIGSINKTYKITKDQLAQIKQFLYIYETYYGNGTMVPKTSWFASTGTEVKLNYIQTPIDMLQRGSAEIASMNKLSTEISNLRLRGENIPIDKANTLALMNKTYRETSDTIEDKIIDMVRSATATTLFFDDYETGQNYMKIYFKYKDNLNNVEAGYIPYINIYDDYSIIVPIKTITNNTTSYDEIYAKFYISKSLYNEIEIYYNNNEYKQID